MPAIEDWITNPLGIVQNLFDGDSKIQVEKVSAYFKERLESPAAAKAIPSLNSTALHDLRTDTLVRLRCMVQDMYDPEFYLGAYEIKDKASGATRLVSGMYRDLASCKPGEELLLDSLANVTCDRQTLYCVPIPGESEWVKAEEINASLWNSLLDPTFMVQCTRPDKDSNTPAYASQAPQCPTSSSSAARNKRGLDEDEDDETEAVAMETEAASSESSAAESSKRTKVEDESDNKSKVVHDLNFPLSGETGPACLVKLYAESDALRVNDVLDIVGILSNDPALAQFPEEEKSSDLTSPEPMESAEEQAAHCPPPSLVPRLHAVWVSKLRHNNPLLPAQLMTEALSPVLAEAAALRTQTLEILTTALLGDGLAAEFLLCHLISTVYARHDVVPLGKFAVNLSGCPRDKPYANGLYKLLSQMVTTSHYLPMTLENMNKTQFCPKKDYQANRLRSGQLQLSANTHLVVDETALQPGQLQTIGLQNLTALGNVVRWQKVEYDFEFHKQDFECNIPVLVLSEGKSLLQCDIQVVLAPSQTAENLEQHLSQLATQLTPDILQGIRTYLTAVRSLDYTLPEGLQKEIEEDFVAMRKEDSKNLTVDSFHQLLVLARLLAQSAGQSTLNRDTWQHAREMEQQRQLRLNQVNAPPS